MFQAGKASAEGILVDDLIRIAIIVVGSIVYTLK